VSTATETADSPHIDRESLKLVVPPVTASNGWRAGELNAGRLQRGVGDALDAAYRGKYGRSSGTVARITADVARATTLRVDPA
jgi:hypothetical protein